jgi:hypothetical protein
METDCFVEFRIYLIDRRPEQPFESPNHNPAPSTARRELAIAEPKSGKAQSLRVDAMPIA